MSSKEHYEKTIQDLHEKVLGQVLDCIKYILHRPNQCDHEDHREVPKRFDDWKAVDNRMASVAFHLVMLMPKYTMSVIAHTNALNELDESRPESIKAWETTVRDNMQWEVVIKANMWIMQHHHEIMAKYGQGHTADIHYDRIISMVEDFNAEALKKIRQAGWVSKRSDELHREYHSLMNDINASVESSAQRRKMH